MLATIAAGLVALLVLAQDPGLNVGDRVILDLVTVLQADEQVFEGERRTNLAEAGRERYTFRIYRVERAEGARLWLVAEKDPGVRGWVKAERVVPLDRAIDYLSDVILTRPTALAYNDRGNVWLNKEEPDRAIRDFSTAIRLDPTNEVMYNNRGTAWRRKKDFDKAIADYSEAIRLDPRYVAPYNNRGNIWRDRKEYDKAIADYDEAIRLDPKLVRAYVSRGVARSGKGESVKAIADYSEAIRLDPGFTLAYHNRGIAWSHRRQYDRAIADYSEAVRLDARYADAYYDRGNAWSAKQEYARALADFSEAIRIDPNHAPAYNARAWCWATCPDATIRDGKKAVESATRACALRAWKDPYNLDTLAAAHAEAGDFDAAVKDLETAVGLITDATQKDDFQARLQLYRARKPYREMP